MRTKRTQECGLPAPPRSDRLRTVNRWLRQLAGIKDLITEEFRFSGRLPLGARLRCWRRGFLSASAELYDLEHRDPSRYLNDYARFVRTPLLNGPYAFLLDNKLASHAILQPFREHLPTLHGAVLDGRLTAVDGPRRDGAAACLADRFPFLPYIGWDLVVTPGPFKVLEANSYSGGNFLQALDPLLDDERTRIFFREHGVIR